MHPETEIGYYKSNDIALIFLESPFEWSNTVKPACLPSGDYDRAFPERLMVSVREFWKKFHGWVLVRS